MGGASRGSHSHLNQPVAPAVEARDGGTVGIAAIQHLREKNHRLRATSRYHVYACKCYHPLLSTLRHIPSYTVLVCFSLTQSSPSFAPSLPLSLPSYHPTSLLPPSLLDMEPQTHLHATNFQLHSVFPNGLAVHLPSLPVVSITAVAPSLAETNSFQLKVHSL